MGNGQSRAHPYWIDDKEDLPLPDADRSGTYAFAGAVYMRVLSDADKADMEFMQAIQGKLPIVFPGGGRAAVEAAVAKLTFGNDTALIAAEQEIIRGRRIAAHETAMADVACRYRNAYAASCVYMSRTMGVPVTSEDDLAAIRDALVAAVNDWFFVYSADRSSFVNRIGMRHEPNTFCFNENLYAGHMRSVPADERGAILRMIAMHIISTYESRVCTTV